MRFFVDVQFTAYFLDIYSSLISNSLFFFHRPTSPLFILSNQWDGLETHAKALMTSVIRLDTL